MLKNIETLWLTELNLSQLNDVQQLLSDCEAFDKGGPIIYPSSLLHTRLPALNGLIYYHHKLIAFVSAYFFYKTACECSLMVSPSYRNRGLANNLLETLVPVLRSQQIEAIYFSASHSFPAENIPRLSFYACEYQLTLQLDKPIKKHTNRLRFRAATFDDIEILCELDQACFANHDILTMALRFKDVIQSPHYHLLVGVLNGKPIAKAHIQWQQKRSILSDIAVFPDYQKQGYGSEVVHACLLESQQRGFKEVMLEVESSNEGALKLYTQQGFEVIKATNFWEMKI